MLIFNPYGRFVLQLTSDSSNTIVMSPGIIELDLKVFFIFSRLYLASAKICITA